MNGTMFGSCFISIPSLDTIHCLAELRFSCSIGIRNGFTVGFINRHLLMVHTGGVGGGGGALYFRRILIGVISDSKVKEFPSRIFVVRIHLDGANIIEARRISSIDIYSLARIQSR